MCLENLRLETQNIAAHIATTLQAIACALVLSACSGGGSSASPPAGGITVVPRDKSVLISWVPEPNVEYWLLYSTSSSISTQQLTSAPGNGKIVQSVVSPYTLGSLANGTTYYFTLNGRTNGGPAGADSPVVSATPRLAGANWSVGTPAGANNLLALAFGGQFIAVGSNGAMFTSPDGIAWTAFPFVVGTDLNAIVYNPNPVVYVAVGASGVILTSIDRTTWTIQNSGITGNLLGITSNGAGLMVATGANGTIVTSPDRVNWTAVASGTPQNLNAVTIGNGLFTAVGNAGVILTSTNGTTWQPALSGTSANLTGIAFDGRRFVAVGAAGTVVTSTDGVNWTPQAAIAPSNLAAVTFGSQFVAVGSGGTIFTSPDGVSWTAATSGTVNNLNAIASANGGYSAVGATGTDLTSY